jgi:hypothetical protein
MFIRRTATRNTTTGESYTTFRLVRSERIGRKVRQVTLLNLGRHFAVAAVVRAHRRVAQRAGGADTIGMS